jgi:hypothetical protein
MKKTFEEIKNEMDSNGYAYFNYEAFTNKTDEICYIPENAEIIEECFNYNDLLKLCEKHIIDNELQEEITASELVDIMFDSIEWTFPSTWLAEYEYN